MLSNTRKMKWSFGLFSPFGRSCTKGLTAIRRATHLLSITSFVIVSGFSFIIALVACIVFFQSCCFSSFTSIRSTSMGRTSRFSGCKIRRSEHSFGEKIVLGQCKTSLKSLQIWEAPPPTIRSCHQTIKRSSYFGLIARRGKDLDH